jgi:hypothetical protein
MKMRDYLTLRHNVNERLSNSTTESLKHLLLKNIS